MRRCYAVHMAEQSSQNVKQRVPFLPNGTGRTTPRTQGVHRVHDGAFLDTLPLAPTDRVLDLCCGSGDFTRTIADLVSEGHVLGLDAQPSMIDEARLRAGANQSFVTGPVQHLATLVPDDAALDVVMSRSALHSVRGPTIPACSPSASACSGRAGSCASRWVAATTCRRCAPFSTASRRGSAARPLRGRSWVRGTTSSSSRRPVSRSSTAGSAPSPSTARSIAWRSSAGSRANASRPTRPRCPRRRTASSGPRCSIDSTMGRPDGGFDQMFVRLDVRVHRPPS